MTVGQLRALLATVPPSFRVFVIVERPEGQAECVAAERVVELRSADPVSIFTARGPEHAIAVVGPGATGPT